MSDACIDECEIWGSSDMERERRNPFMCSTGCNILLTRRGLIQNVYSDAVFIAFTLYRFYGKPADHRGSLILPFYCPECNEVLRPV